MIKVNNRKGLEASLIPMVNLIFILLIFFLLVTEIKPKEFFVVNPPSSIQELIAGDIKIQLDPATGQRIVKKIGKDKSQKIDLDIYGNVSALEKPGLGITLDENWINDNIVDRIKIF